MYRLVLAVALLAFHDYGFAQTSFPMITHCTPTALQRGTSVEVTVEGQMNFAGAYRVLFEEDRSRSETSGRLR